MRTILIFLCLCFFVLNGPEFAQPPSSHAVAAKVLGISDQNLVLVERADRPGIKMNIQIRGYQLPHRSGECKFERSLGQQVTKAIQDLVGAKGVTLLNPLPSSDLRTAEAEIINYDGINIGKYLFLELGLAQPRSGAINIAWCGKGY